MVEHSQKPGEGSCEFVQAMQEILRPFPVLTTAYSDPIHSNRQLLAVDIGDPEGKQALVATSHADVVGVEGQHWSTRPWKLTERDGYWFGRGTCDTHGTGVSMLLAGLREDVHSLLTELRKRVTLLFTYDEEATSPGFSMRGARLAAGLLGNERIIESKYFVVGEPTEINGEITPMRGHKGRLLAHFKVSTTAPGHVSQPVENALMSAGRIIHEIDNYGRMMTYGHNDANQHCQIFSPPYTTVQVSAGRVKDRDYSTTPSDAEFTVDARTIPHYHNVRTDEILTLIERQKLPPHTTVTVRMEKSALGSITDAASPIVRLAEEATGKPAVGFNGGTEGRIFRNDAGMEGVTLGPGDLQFAHMSDERIRIASLFEATDIFSQIFKKAAALPSVSQ